MRKLCAVALMVAALDKTYTGKTLQGIIDENGHLNDYMEDIAKAVCGDDANNNTIIFLFYDDGFCLRSDEDILYPAILTKYVFVHVD